MVAAAPGRGSYPPLSRKPSEARMGPSGGEYAGGEPDHWEYSADSEVSRSPGGERKQWKIEVVCVCVWVCR